MNIFTKFINWVLSFFDEKVDWSLLDTSFLVFSDHPKVGNGWVKGWVLDLQRVVVCTHSNPSLGGDVHIWLKGEKITRKIINMYHITGSDITICDLSDPFPEDVVIYPIASKYRNLQKVVTYHQDRRFSTRRLNEHKATKTVSGKYGDRAIISGDSGLPWIIWDNGFKIISHNYLGNRGVGPDYTKYSSFLK